MTLLDYAKRVVRYGPQGVSLWARIKWGEFQMKRFLKRNAKHDDMETVRGVTLVGSFTGRDSIN